MAGLGVEEPPKTRAGSGLWRRVPEDVKEALRYCAVVWLTARVALVVLGILAVALLPIITDPNVSNPPNRPTDVPGWKAPPAQGQGWDHVVTAWERWDALWFLKIASSGYEADDGSAAFFPLYPLAIRTVDAVPGVGPLGAALIVSNIAYLAALVVLFLLTKFEFDERIARRTIVYLAVFPTAFFFFAPYSESLFLLFAASSLYGARRGRWWVAGLCGALASATRSIGVALVIPLLIEAVRQYRALPASKDRRWELAWSSGWSLVAGAGTFLYLTYWWGKIDDFWHPLRAQGGWLRDFSWPWDTIRAATDEAFNYIGRYSGGYHFLDWLIVVPVLVAAVWVLMRSPLAYGAYVWLSLLVPMSLIFGPRPFMSVPRFAVTMFPIFWAFARFADRFKAHNAIVAISTGGMGVMTVLFVNWYFVF